MAAPKGNTFSPGRKKGGANKTTTATKELITAFMQEKFSDVKTAWEGLDDAEKVKTYISLVKYVMPTLSSVKVEDSNGDDVLKNFLKKEK